VKEIEVKMAQLDQAGQDD
jgi:hypothetical protein